MVMVISTEVVVKTNPYLSSDFFTVYSVNISMKSQFNNCKNDTTVS